MKRVFVCLIGFWSFLNLNAQTILINQNAVWRYNDSGQNLYNTWKDTSYNSTAWASGPAELGYGDGDEATVVSYGGNSNNKHITTYFIRKFNVSNAASFSSLNLELVCDDGAVVYLNGVEVARYNMPNGPIFYNTLASSTINWPNEDNWNTFTLSSAPLVNGTNTLAVEVHQSEATSSDISFNLKLTGNTGATNNMLLRGPYLQIGTQQSIVVKWRTQNATDSRVKFGSSLTLLDQTAYNTKVTTEHEVLITGLQPHTQYYYQIEGNGQIHKAASSNQYFITSPEDTYRGLIKFWVIGDAGMANRDQRAVYEAFKNFNNGPHADGWIMLGDNAYEGGKDNEYQNAVFKNMYEQTLENTVLWPAPGNHDYNNHIPFSTIYYYDIFTLPSNAEAGGVASGTEKYYSYNYGNVHFVVLDSYDEDRGASAPMANWLKQDLQANTKEWTVAYFHHPPYTKGSHNSDNSNFLDGELVDMRQNIVPILETYGVDLVLCGHSHCYERSMLIDGHYGKSNTFNSTYIKNNSLGNYPISCAYVKTDSVSKANKGAIYAVVGCSGKLSGTSSGWPHPVTKVATNTVLGSMILEIEENKLRARFIDTNATVYDDFTIVKNVNKRINYNVCQGQPLSLSASWPGNYVWNNGNTDETITFSPTNDTTLIVRDGYNCLADTFRIQINTGNPPCPPPLTFKSGQLNQKEVVLSPQPVSLSKTLTVHYKNINNENLRIEFYSLNGSLLHYVLASGLNNTVFIHLPETNLSKGQYLVKLMNNAGQTIAEEKLVIID